MNDYFLNLFNYDKFANDVILNCIFEAGEPEKPVQLMAHLLAAQQVWLKRCKGLSTVGAVLWPDWKADTFEKLINDNHKGWVEYVSSLQPQDFDKIIAYKNTKGEDFENELADILAHVINHGTHHRAQAGQQLKLAGLENLPLTDYILYVRS